LARLRLRLRLASGKNFNRLRLRLSNRLRNRSYNRLINRDDYTSLGIRQETNFYDKNNCLSIESTKQVQRFENVISIGFPGSSKSKIIFGPFYIFEKRTLLTDKFSLLGKK
jgi:hypothetical protein